MVSLRSYAADSPATTPDAEAAKPAASATEPAKADQWPVEGKTTEDEVRSKLGRPFSENHTDPFHLGQYVLMYDGKDGTMYAFLFGKDNVLVHLRVYARTAP